MILFMRGATAWEGQIGRFCWRINYPRFWRINYLRFWRTSGLGKFYAGDNS